MRDAKELRGEQNQFVFLLHPHLKPSPIKGNSTVQTDMTATLKTRKKVFYGKAATGPTEGKNYQTMRKSNGTTAANIG